jgi:hypothetical protein
MMIARDNIRLSPPFSTQFYTIPYLHFFEMNVQKVLKGLLVVEIILVILGILVYLLKR